MIVERKESCFDFQKAESFGSKNTGKHFRDYCNYKIQNIKDRIDKETITNMYQKCKEIVMTCFIRIIES